MHLKNVYAKLETLSSASQISTSSDNATRVEIQSLNDTVNKLLSWNDDLDNRSRRNNLILHGES